MLLSRYILGLIGAFTIVHGSRRNPNVVKPPGRALKQATRSEIVMRATRPHDFRRRQGQASPLPPQPGQCPGFSATGTVPYARWTNLDYDSIVGATRFMNTPTREACTKLCELDNACILSTYEFVSLDCFKVANQGTYYSGPYAATTKGITCESNTATAIKQQFPAATCCTEYRSAPP